MSVNKDLQKSKLVLERAMFLPRSIPKNLIALSFLCFFSMQISAQKSYPVHYHLADKKQQRSASAVLDSSFATQMDAEKYIDTLPLLLKQKGFITASVDSASFDSSAAQVYLYLGYKWQWIIWPDSSTARLPGNLNYKPGAKLSYSEFQKLKDEVMNYYENNGHPFAKISFDTVAILPGVIQANIHAEPGVIYHIDSIRVFGNARIKNKFLQRYLDIADGSVYNRSTLTRISKSIANLPYLQETNLWDLTMLGTGATLNLYLQPRRSSEVNALIGFLPGNSITGKTKITADVKLNLRNALGSGETVLVNWQQLEAQSPRLDLGYNQPYIFNSPFGIDFSFGMLKKDSSWLQLKGRIGAQYFWSANSLVNIFYALENSYLLQGGIDTNQIIITHTLPPYIDVSSGSLGVGYLFDNTNYKLNPRNGNQIQLTAAAGIKKVTPNNDILQLKDPVDPDYDFRLLYDSIRQSSYKISISGSAAHYFNLHNNSVIKLAAQGGWLQTPQAFQNELFRIGGYHLLRGFDEESIYANRYAVFTAEYRYITGFNSFLFGFTDAGFTKYESSGFAASNSFLSGGLGLELETKFGLLNISYAVGKRNDVKFDIRNASKIHFGYINYF